MWFIWFRLFRITLFCCLARSSCIELIRMLTVTLLTRAGSMEPICRSIPINFSPGLTSLPTSVEYLEAIVAIVWKNRLTLRELSSQCLLWRDQAGNISFLPFNYITATKSLNQTKSSFFVGLTTRPEERFPGKWIHIMPLWLRHQLKPIRAAIATKCGCLLPLNILLVVTKPRLF